MRFEIDSKELNSMLGKVAAVTSPKSQVPALSSVYMDVSDGTLKVFGCDSVQHLELKCEVRGSDTGAVRVSVDDLKVMEKMTGWITVEDNVASDILTVKSDKRAISIPCGAGYDSFVLTKGGDKELVLTVDESWLLETVTSLLPFTSKEDTAGRQMRCFHFNTVEKRVEALEGHMVGMRKIDEQWINRVDQMSYDGVLFENTCVPVFKKVLSKGSGNKVMISEDSKNVYVDGDGFSYMARRVEGKYFDVNSVISFEPNYQFAPMREEMVESMKYSYDLVKRERFPAVFHVHEGKLYAFTHSSRYETLEKIQTEQLEMGDVCVGFNPHYLMEIFKTVDSDFPTCSGYGSKGPLLVNGDQYSFLVLPVNIETNLLEKMHHYFDMAA